MSVTGMIDHPATGIALGLLGFLAFAAITLVKEVMRFEEDGDE